MYVLNTAILPLDYNASDKYLVEASRIDVETAKTLITSYEKRGAKVESAVGHSSTARLLTRLLGREVAYNRQQVKLQRGDAALCLMLKTRLPEGKVLDDDELGKIEYELVWLEVK